MTDTFTDLLNPQRLSEIVDIGANPIDGVPPYAVMLSSGLCRVTGFEPQADAFETLQQNKGSNERYLASAIGDGREHRLSICVGPGMSSLLEPDPAALELFDVLKTLGEVTHELPVQTRRLDEVSEIEHLDFLKIDAQGSELAVFQGGRQKLSEAVVVQTEVSFVTLYKNQPAFGDIDLELRRQGFMPHCIAEIKHWPISPCVLNNDPRRPLKQLLEADVVYIRDLTRPALMSDEQLKHLALIAHHCYGSYDLALRCVMLLESRGVVAPETQASYLKLIQPKQNQRLMFY